MADITAQIEPRALERLRRKVDARAFPGILASAINDAGRWGETRVGRAVRQEVPLKVADVKRVIKRKKATRGDLESIIHVRREPISMKRYAARQTKKGVTAKPRRNKPRELLKSAFISERLGGHVYKRRGKERLPIDRVQGPTVVGVLAGVPGMLAEQEEGMRDYLLQRAKSKVDAYLERKATR